MIGLAGNPARRELARLDPTRNVRSLHARPHLIHS
jgi:hypothetical protein